MAVQAAPRDADPRLRRPFPLRAGVVEVTAVTTVTPRMIRVTLAGDALDAFPVEEPGEIVTLLWPAPGRDLVLPETGWRFPPGVADAQHARNYTVRRCPPGAGAIEVDFFLHGDLGRAARWAERVRPGDRVGIAGPRVHWDSTVASDWSLLVADETGLPALAAILETLPAGHRAIAVIEVADRAEEQPIVTDADADVRWVHRGDAPPGTSPALAETVRRLELPPGGGRAWGGGEAAAMRDVRRHLTGERGLPAASVSVLGYWKHRDTAGWD